MPAVELLIRTKLLSDMANKIKLAGKTFNVGNKISQSRLKEIAKKTHGIVVNVFGLMNHQMLCQNMAKK